ncbi:EF hand family protein [Tritrichomonas foetus]|uniref:EF hand family protein n=1 Tax=Tritrichomonas foetus TaxID=1144522 RepID=A0A1J4JZQ9_9EUKA|nr:EF hand family protein [Tritrichomonas foetus]|eukprot:OHT04649.1 EF hand family protein [Tritrichomonas foetus]
MIFHEIRFKKKTKMSSKNFENDDTINSKKDDMALQSEIDSIPGEKWIDKLKFVFDEADTNKSGVISLDEWMNSRLRYLISDKLVTDSQMKEIFHLIDFNCDMLIEWNELIDFLMTHDNGIDTQNVEKKLKITFAAPNDAIMQKSHRRNPNFKILYLSSQSEFVTLTDYVMTFWNPDDCNPIRTFTDDSDNLSKSSNTNSNNDTFCDFCELRCLSKIVITKSNRQIIFYDIRTHKKMEFILSATLEINDIPKMSFKESKSAIVGHGLRRIPLFNKPTSIVAHKDQPIIFVGDDDGNVEIFKLITSGAAKIDWAAQRLYHVRVHNDEITQILYLDDNNAYVSSSLDGTFVIWRYSHSDNKFSQAFKINIRNNLQIQTFVYDKRTRDVVFTTNSHYFGIWRTFTTHQEIIETRSEVIQTLAIIPFSEDASFCVTISKKNSIGLYRMPNMEIIDSHYLGLQHELCPPASAFFMRDNLYLGGAFLSRWTCKNSTNEGLSAHKSPIVSAMTNDVFGRILSIDQSGEFISWDITTGRKVCSVSLNELDCLVLCAQQDPIGRRIAVGYSNGLVKFVSANSGTCLSEIEKNVVKGGCNYVMFANIFNTNRIICCSSSKYAVLFEDLSGNRVRFIRKFVGHTEPVTKCSVLKEKFLLTIGSDRELFLWNIQMQNPIVKYQMPNDPTVALDLPNPDTYLVGDVFGNIHVMRLDAQTPVMSFKGVGMTIKSPLTTLLLGERTPLLISGNLHGYLKYWTLESGKFVERGRFRAHDEAILSISLSGEYNVLTTASRDEEIKLWSLEPFGCIGALGKAHKFVLEDKSSWESKTPLPDDPMHFMDPLEAEMVIAEREKIAAMADEEKEKKEDDDDDENDIELPPFSFEAVQNMYDNTETQCLTGRICIQKMNAMKKEDVPNSARVKPPQPLNIELVDNNLIQKTINMMDQALSRPKIWKPKGKI